MRYPFVQRHRVALWEYPGDGVSPTVDRRRSCLIYRFSAHSALFLSIPVRCDSTNLSKQRLRISESRLLVCCLPAEKSLVSRDPTAFVLNQVCRCNPCEQRALAVSYAMSEGATTTSRNLAAKGSFYSSSAARTTRCRQAHPSSCPVLRGADDEHYNKC